VVVLVVVVALWCYVTVVTARSMYGHWLAWKEPRRRQRRAAEEAAEEASV